MKTIIRWYLPWVALFALIYLLCGCEAEGISPVVEAPDAAAGAEIPTVSSRGPRVGLDAGSAPDVGGAVDTVPVVPGTDAEPGTDAVPVIPKLDSGVGVEAKLPGDAAPAIPCDKLGPFPPGSAYPIILPTTAYCFQLCPEARDPIDPLDYAWTCTGFTDADRTITVNGVQVLCAGQARSVLPTTVDGVWTFALSAGGHTNDFIAWSGALRACP
jgi:hypothetical protein